MWPVPGVRGRVRVFGVGVELGDLKLISVAMLFSQSSISFHVLRVYLSCLLIILALDLRNQKKKQKK